MAFTRSVKAFMCQETMNHKRWSSIDVGIKISELVTTQMACDINLFILLALLGFIKIFVTHNSQPS